MYTVDAVEALECESDTDTYRFAYDASATSPSLAVVSALDSLSDGGLDAGVPLYDAVDPDALDQILSSESAAAADRCAVTFSAFGFRITVSSRGQLEVRPVRDRNGAVESE